MSERATGMLKIVEALPRISGMRIGRIVAVERRRGVLVDYPENLVGPLSAQVVESITPAIIRKAAATGQQVLLGFADNDPRLPIVLGMLTSSRPATAARHPTQRPVRAARVPQRAISRDTPCARIARLTSVRDGVACVRCEDHGNEAIPARTAIRLRNLEDPVLVLFAADGGAVIIGQLYPTAELELPGTSDCDVALRGRRVQIEAETELVLVSGRVRVHLDSRGKATTTADNIVSRARGANRVQGGSVHLN